jgi:hypothetical protein
LHLDADAVSRLLQGDEQPYVPPKDFLRDDICPLSSKEVALIKSKYLKDDEWILNTITDHRANEVIRLAIEKTKNSAFEEAIQAARLEVEPIELPDTQS